MTPEKNPIVKIEPEHVHVWGARFKPARRLPGNPERRTRDDARLDEIALALADAQLDGWLFYDFRLSDPLAYRILGLSRRRHRNPAMVLLRAGARHAARDSVGGRGASARRARDRNDRLSFARRDDRRIAQGARRRAANRDGLFARLRDSVRLARRCRHDRNRPRDRSRGGHGRRSDPALRGDA